MNPREKRLAIIVGVLVGTYVLYLGVDRMFIGSVRDAKKKRVDYYNKYDQLTKLIKEKERAEGEWREAAARTFSFDESIARGKLDFELKRIAGRHGFDRPSVKNAVPLRIGYQTPQIKSHAKAVTISGDYAKVMAFLREIYHSPFLCQVTNVTLVPLPARYGRNSVKLDVVVETPVLPQRVKDVEFSESPTTMPADASETPRPFRTDVAPERNFAMFERRNILREFMPPPVNIVMLDNQDRKMVGVQGKFYWEGAEETQFRKWVDGKKQLQIEGPGDVVELTIAYADGKTVGPVRHEFAVPGPWAHGIESHTPPPPPEYVNLSVDNRNSDEILVNIVITTPDNKQITPPTMLIEPNRVVDIGEWNAHQIQVSARYRSNKPAPGGTYMPSDLKQTLMIPPEPAEAFATTPEGRPSDSPADERYTVAGLWTYREAQEMIATSAEGRHVFTVGAAGEVDGGTLLAVHPLGGIVVMPSGNYYLYPLGKGFGKRVLLEAQDEEQLAEAIDLWARQ